MYGIGTFPIPTLIPYDIIARGDSVRISRRTSPHRKLRMTELSDGEDIVILARFVYSIPACVTRTDGRKCYVGRA